MESNHFLHCKLTVGDLAAAKKFHKSIFDWKFQDLGHEMGNYVLLDLGTKDSGGGITPKMMPDQPTSWVSYVEVASVEKTMAKAVKAGPQQSSPIRQSAPWAPLASSLSRRAPRWASGKRPRRSLQRRPQKRRSPSQEDRKRGRKEEVGDSIRGRKARASRPRGPLRAI